MIVDGINSEPIVHCRCERPLWMADVIGRCDRPLLMADVDYRFEISQWIAISNDELEQTSFLKL